MKRIITICISALFCVTAMAQQSHVVAFHNVENLFDTINSPTTADEDMLPLADRQWTAERYKAKLKNICKNFQYQVFSPATLYSF